MSTLQERTLVVKNFDFERTTDDLLKELCLQAGPVKNVVLKPDHAFVEYEDVESVGYAKALLNGVSLFGRSLVMEPKLRSERYSTYTKLLNDYIKYNEQQQNLKRYQEQQQQQYAMQQPYPSTQTQMYPPQSISDQAPLPLPLNNYQTPLFTPNQQQWQFQTNMHPSQQQQMPQSSYYHTQNYQRQPDMAQQWTPHLPGPYLADPSRPAPEGRGYMPWLHDGGGSMHRTRSFQDINGSILQQQQQQRRFSDRPTNFHKRRR